MGSCISCIKFLFSKDSDVRINVIEPTTIINGEQIPSTPNIPPPAYSNNMGPTLKVPTQKHNLRI